MPSGHRIDWSEYDEILRRELPKMTVVEFTRTYLPQFSNRAVGTRARRLGIRPAKHFPSEASIQKMVACLNKETPEMVQRIRDMRDTTSLWAMSKELGIGYATITRIIKKHGIKLSDAGRWRALHSQYRKPDTDTSDPEMRARIRRRLKTDVECSVRYRESTLGRYLKYKLSHLNHQNSDQGNRRTASGLPRPKHEVTITINDLLDLWGRQGGKCAITGKKMEHKSCLYAVSIDRIRSDGGYTPDNVQLLCQAINLGKNRHSNEDMLHFWKEDSL